MQWEDNVRGRFYYRCREHQRAQLTTAIGHAGDLKGKSVLDVGCGYGDLLRYLPDCRYYGIDTNADAVEEAQRLHPTEEFAVTDMVRPADVVIAVATLQMCDDKRSALLSWVSAARERLVVVTCLPEKLPVEIQGEPWWEGIERECFPDPGGDDFQTYVVLPPDLH